MKKIKGATVTVTININYTETINELIENGEIQRKNQIENVIKDFLEEDIEKITPNNSKASIVIE